MRRFTPILIALGLLAAPNAMADGPMPVPGQPSNHACRVIGAMSQAQVRAATAEPPPPPDMFGASEPTQVAATRLCPEGQLPVQLQTPEPRVGKIRPTLTAQRRRELAEERTQAIAAAAPEKTAQEQGYSYVGDEWTAETFGLMFETELSEPTVSGYSGAHSISQLNLASNGNARYSIEFGWIKEVKDTEEGYSGPRVFVFINPDEYGKKAGPPDCYDCYFTPSAGAKSDPIGVHFYPTDGTPKSRDLEGHAPATVEISMGVEQYKGAWWLWFAKEWIGSITDYAYSPTNSTQPFKKGKVPSIYGEVYDQPNKPTTQMGNGNFGGCSCATSMHAPWLMPIKAKAQSGTWTQVGLHNPLQNVETPTWYNSGTITGERTDFHFGGPGAK